jgi:hypothetical protein
VDEAIGRLRSVFILARLVLAVRKKTLGGAKRSRAKESATCAAEQKRGNQK